MMVMVVCPHHPCMRQVCGHGSRPLRRVASASLVLCGAEQRLDQRAERQPSHGIHGLCPAPLVTEAADTRIVIGVKGRGNTGLSYRLSHLHVDVHVVCPPLRHTPHRQVCRTEAPRTRSAGSRCRRSGIARRTAAILRPFYHGSSPPGMRSCQHARALMRPLWLIRRDRYRGVRDIPSTLFPRKRPSGVYAST